MFLAHMPSFVLRWICILFGNIAMIILPGRKRILMSNLRHAFPDRKLNWCKKICRENFYRLIELGLLAISLGFLTKRRIRSSFKISASNRAKFEDLAHSKSGAIVLIPHFTLMEGMTLLRSILHDIDAPDIGIIYRPFKNASLEKFVKKTREKNGMKLLSRKNGFFEAMKMLRNGGIVGMLFDQNAGDAGCLMNFLGREISSTDLPVLFFKKFAVPIYVLYPRRLGFWRASISIHNLNFDKNDPKTILFAANKFLEDRLRSSDSECADWLWAHDRWKISNHERRENSSSGRCKDWLKWSLAYSHETVVRKTKKIFIRMPNWLGDIVMAVPVVRMLKNFHSDAELTLLAKQEYIGLLKALGISDHVVRLPDHGLLYFMKLFRLADEYPDIYISLVNSFRGCVEAKILRARHRIGLGMKDRKYRKYFFNYLYDPVKSTDIKYIHQTRLWQEMLRWYGFDGFASLSPFGVCQKLNDEKKLVYLHSIGIFCGSANDPSKRWPVELWKRLIERILESYKDAHINLYGSKCDVEIANLISSSFRRDNVTSMAGKMNLLELSFELRKNDLIISVDTGGMHLANMLGCSLVCIFGKTNSLVTGPIFSGKSIVVRPPACPATGGFKMENVEVKSVLRAVEIVLKG